MKTLLLILLAFTIVACNEKTSDLPKNCRPVNHGMGETCVPLNPERVVALNSSAIDTLLVLEMKPVGVISNTVDLLGDRTMDITKVGQEGTVNLETIVKLQPDLIIGSVYNDENIYPQLSQIAPTVLRDGETNGEWQEDLLFNAEVLGKKEEAQQLLAEYEQRLADFQAQMGQRLQEVEISLVRVYPEQISIYLNNSFAGTILEDAGLSRPDFQSQGIRGKAPFQIMISREETSLADGDVIFLWTYGTSAEIKSQAESQLNQLKNDPLWQQLGAVKNGQVYQIPPYWNVPSLMAANRVVDDLFRYLVNEN